MSSEPKTVTRRRWTKGYSQSELDAAQARFGLSFPPDLIDLLRERRPIDGHDWNDKAAIRKALNWPFEGLLFDVEQNALWWPEWGERPAQPAARKEVLTAVVAKAPKLIPLLGHRYLPSSPCEAGNPVFSVYQSDVIHYGANLTDYFEREFESDSSRPWPDNIKHIAFWSEMAAHNT